MVRSPGCGILAILLAACGGNSDRVPLAEAVIGPAGGTLVVSGGQLSLSVPPGALSTEIAFRIDGDSISKVPGFVDVGPAYAFSPRQTTFATASRIVVPYDPARVPTAADNSELRVGLRNGAGQVSALLPLQVDDVLGRVVFETLELGTFWVGAPDVFTPADLWPLHDGDRYRYDSGLVATVARTVSEPNLAPIEVAKLTWTRIGRTTGLYLDDRSGHLAKLGEFDVGFSQERLDSPLLLLNARDTIGTSRAVVGTYLGYQPPFSPLVGYTGLCEITTDVLERVRVSTPLGQFDTVRVRIVTRFSETLPLQGTERLELWLAGRVGPVQLRFDDGAVERVTEAVVGGTPVRGG